MKSRSILLLFLGDATRDRRVQNFSRFFQQYGWNVELLSPVPSIASGWRKFFHYQRWLLHEVRSRSADIVLPCDLYSLSAAKWMKTHGRANVLVYDARELYTELPAVAKSQLKKSIWKRQERRGLMQTDIITITAPDDAQAICDVHHFLPRPVLVRNLPWRNSELKSNASLLQQFDIPANVKTVVYIGGITRGRALRKIIQAVKELPVHLLLIGDGVLVPELKKLVQQLQIENRIHFAGTIESNEALATAASCDAGICLVEPISKSYALGLPSKIFEYMMCGIPVIANRLKQVNDLFPNDEWLSYVDETNAHSIADGITSALKNSESREVRDRERSLALDEYHFERDVENFRNALQSFLK